MSSSIKFTHSHEQQLEFDLSGMGLVGLLSLGALEATSSYAMDNGVCKKVYETDKEGLAKSVGRAEGILSQLHSCISSVSTLAANANMEEVGDSATQDIFYLLAELGKLSDQVAVMRSNMSDPLAEPVSFEQT